MMTMSSTGVLSRSGRSQRFPFVLRALSWAAALAAGMLIGVHVGFQVTFQVTQLQFVEIFIFIVAAVGLGRSIPAWAVRTVRSTSTARCRWRISLLTLMLATATLGSVLGSLGILVKGAFQTSLRARTLNSLRNNLPVQYSDAAALAADKEVSVRMLVAGSLAGYDDRRMRQLLIQMLDDDAPAVRAAAIGSLGEAGEQSMADRLAQIMLEDNSIAVCRAAGVALDRIGPPSELAVVAKSAKDDTFATVRWAYLRERQNGEFSEVETPFLGDDSAETPAFKTPANDTAHPISMLKERARYVHFNRQGEAVQLSFNGRRAECTDVELRTIADLSELEFLDLSFTEVTDRGMEHVCNLPKLKLLNLCYTRVTDGGIALLVGMPRLESLHLPDSCTNDALRHVSKMNNLRSLGITGSRVTDEGLVHLKECETLETISLPTLSPGVTENGLAHLIGLKNVRSIGLPHRITDVGLGHLSAFEDFENLYICPESEITDAGLAQIAGLTKMRYLHLPPGITDEGLAHLADMTKLWQLGLRDTAVTGAGLEHIQQMKELHDLGLPGTVGDEGLERLKALPKLRSLCLQGDYTDGAITYLKELTGLQRLHLIETRITPQGLAALQEQLPGLVISQPAPSPFGPP